MLRGMPSLATLAKRQPGDREFPHVRFASEIAGERTYPMVHVPCGERTGRMWVGRLPGLAGGVPLEREVRALREFGVRRIVCLVPMANLRALAPVRDYPELGRKWFGDGFHLLEVMDFGTPPDDQRFEAMVARVDRALAEGEQVLAHCFAGCGRTGMFVACVLVRAGYAAADAVRLYRRHRGCGPETPEQVAYVQRFAQRLAGGAAQS